MSDYHCLKKRITGLIALQNDHLFSKNLIGLEKESLRVNNSGGISQRSHPKTLGSALAHPYITTDYSEALTEFITPPVESIKDALVFLQNTQKFVYQNLDNEILWATSMPCVVAGESSIPLARYGNSNAGMMKMFIVVGLGIVMVE
jgi:glutamate--cysteine ligase